MDLTMSEELTIEQTTRNLLMDHTCDNCTYKSPNDYCYWTEYDDQGNKHGIHSKEYKKYSTCKDWSFIGYSAVLSQAEINELLSGELDEQYR
jgi:hypothetical protein